jgi:hypothetical protein
MGVVIRSNDYANVVILTWNGSALAALQTNLPAAALNGMQWVADFDGDGLDDFAYTQANGAAYDVMYRRNLGISAGTQTFESPPRLLASGMVRDVLSTTTPQVDVSAPDFNSDGKADVLYQSSEPEVCTFEPPLGFFCTNPKIFTNVLLSTPTGLTNVAGWSCEGIFCAPTITGDFNGDSQVDFLSVNLPAVELRLGTGRGVTAPTAVNPTEPIFNPVIVDYDNDGRDDVLALGCGNHCVYRSTGSGFAAGIATGIPASETYTLRSIDLDGNGLPDIGYEASGSWRVRPFNGVFPDLLTRATDGFGCRTPAASPSASTR